MAVTVGPRTGVTRWSAGGDPFSRAQLDADHAAIDDLMAVDGQGTLAARPAAGIRGRYYYATDTGILSRDTGAAWVSVTDHGGLVGLADDDHPQYHNNARGDARYPLLTVLTADGDLVTRTAGAWARLALGGAGTFLKSGGAAAAWAALSSADIADLAEAIRDRLGATLVAGPGIGIVPDDAGDIVTISYTGASTLLVVKNTDEAVTNSATLQNDDELAGALLANTDYAFEVRLRAVSTSSTPDIKVAFTVPAGAALYWSGLVETGTTGAITPRAAGAPGLPILASGTAVPYDLDTAAGGSSIAIWGTVKNGANAGNLTMQWAQDAATIGATVTVKAGSALRLYKE